MYVRNNAETKGRWLARNSNKQMNRSACRGLVFVVFTAHSWVFEDGLKEMMVIQKCQAFVKGFQQHGFCRQRPREGQLALQDRTLLDLGPSILAKGNMLKLPSLPLQLRGEVGTLYPGHTVPRFLNRTDLHQDSINT